MIPATSPTTAISISASMPTNVFYLSINTPMSKTKKSPICTISPPMSSKNADWGS
jgi:hypothetical protein